MRPARPEPDCIGVIQTGFVPLRLGMARMVHGNTRVDWNFCTVPQTGAKDRKIAEPRLVLVHAMLSISCDLSYAPLCRGKIVGGSSAVSTVDLPRVI